MPNSAQYRTSAAAEGAVLVDRLNYTPYYMFGEYASQTCPGTLSYVQPPLSALSGSRVPFHRSPPQALEYSHAPQAPGRSSLDFFANPFSDRFATAASPEWQYRFQPQIPPSPFPTTAIGTDAASVHYAAPSTVDHHAPTQSMPSPAVSSAPAAASDTQNCVMGCATPAAVAGNVLSGSSIIVMVTHEITLPYDKLVLSSCDLESPITLSDALKKDFSRIPGDSSARRAFPSQDCAAKLAFWLVFDLGSDFRSRRQQVTVVTTRKRVIQQPSMARLAHLVAREMERYLAECAMKQKPFPYTLDEIFLRRIDLASKGTLRPRFYVQARQPRSISRPPPLAETW